MVKTTIYSTVRVYSPKFRCQYNFFCLKSVFIESLESKKRCCYVVDLWSYFKSFGIMNYALFWYACTARGISTNHARLICCGTVSATGQDGGCKQCGQTAMIRLKTLFMSRLAVCSRDLHWHWINWTLFCDTMEVSMLRLVWLPIAQHVFQPALTGMLELISRKIDSCEQEQRLSWWADFTKIVSRELDARSYRDFAKNIALLGATSAKFAI